MATKKLSKQEKTEFQGNTVIPGGNNQTWRRKWRQEDGDYFTLQCIKTGKFLTALNASTMNISGRFAVIYRLFSGSFWSYLI